MSGKDVILIVGAGRSGTSALARVLGLCGCALPQSVVGPMDLNPKGSWEPVDIWTLNHDLMLRHGTEYTDPTMRLQETIDTQEREEYIGRVQRFLSECAYEPTMIVKQPDIAEVLEFWTEAARREGAQLRLVIPIRHPQEVSLSIAATGRTVSTELTNAFWLKRNLLAERYSREFPRVFVDYGNLLRDWRVEVNRVSKALSVCLKPDEATINDFLTPSLHRQAYAGPVIETFAYSWVTRVHAILSAAAKDTKMDLHSMDEIYHAYCVSERSFRIAWDEFRTWFDQLDKDRFRASLGNVPVLQAGRDF